MNIRDELARVGFTPEEKMDLTARLERAAEQEETMTDQTKHKIKKWSGGMVFGIAAAAVMTAGALAATLSPGLSPWSRPSVPSIPQAPVRDVLSLDRSEPGSGTAAPDQSAAPGGTVVPDMPAAPDVPTAPDGIVTPAVPAVPNEPAADDPGEEIYIPPTPGLSAWFDTTAPGASEALEDGICRLGRSETYNGWTVTLDECTGDSSSVYIHVTLAAPEGVVLDGDCFYGLHSLTYGGSCVSGGNMYHLPDEDPSDNRIAFLIQDDFIYESLKGGVVSVEVSDLLNYWWEQEDAGLTEEEAVFYAQLSELAAPIRGHVWTFEDVALDFSAQTVRMVSGTQVPYLDGTTTVTSLEASPFNATLRVEGGSIAALADYRVFPIDEGVAVQDSEKRGPSRKELQDALTVEVVLRDGTALPLTIPSSEHMGRTEGIEGPDTPFVEIDLRCAEISYLPSRIWDPAQVDHITVCGVDIPVSPEA